MNEIEMSISEWWENAHATKSYYVSDFGGLKLWNSLNILPLIKNDSAILEIGVGNGKNTMELFKKGCNVHVLDISILALEKVRSYSTKQWLESEIEDIPENTFDAVISHLVSQHLSNDALLKQLKSIIPTLKPDGIFAMQFACWLDEQIYDESLGFQKTGYVCRTLDQMQNLVATAGGMISWVSPDTVKFINYRSCWYFIHIQKGV